MNLINRLGKGKHNYAKSQRFSYVFCSCEFCGLFILRNQNNIVSLHTLTIR